MVWVSHLLFKSNSSVVIKLRNFICILDPWTDRGIMSTIFFTQNSIDIGSQVDQDS